MGKTLKFKEFDRVERLRRRADYINSRIKSGQYSKGSHSYLLQELSALDWAIPILEDHMINKTVKRMSPEVRAQFGFLKDGRWDDDETSATPKN